MNIALDAARRKSWPGGGSAVRDPFLPPNWPSKHSTDPKSPHSFFSISHVGNVGGIVTLIALCSGVNCTPKCLFEPMNEQIDYASQILSRLIESLGSALPGIFAGLVVVVAFFVAAVMSRKLLRRLLARVEADKRPLVTLASALNSS